MIPIPQRWHAENRDEDVVLTHPAGAEAGFIIYRDRQRPLRRVGALVREALGQQPSFHATRIDVPQRLVTYEGEYAALVTVQGRCNDAAEQFDFGFVFGDDFYASIMATCRDLACASTATDVVRDLVLHDSQALGVRRRRFEYAPPPGWQPTRRGLATSWISPDYPRDETWLVVYAANPVALVPDMTVFLEQLASGGCEIDEACASNGVAFGALRGRSQQIRGRMQDGKVLWREAVLLRDDRYAYAFEMSSHTPQAWSHARNALMRVLRSAQPIPDPRIAPPQNTFAHWSD